MGGGVGKEAAVLINKALPEFATNLEIASKVFGKESAEIITKVLSELVTQLPHAAKLFGRAAIEVILRDPCVKLFLITLIIYRVYKTLLIIQQLDCNLLRRNKRKFILYPVISMICLGIVYQFEKWYRNKS